MTQRLLSLIKLFCLQEFYTLLVGALGALIVLVVFHIAMPSPSHIGIVNVTALVDQFVKAQIQLSPDQRQARIKAFGENLEQTLKQVSSQQHLVLLPSEAVIAGARDYTSDIQRALR